jgi:ketosteroid isomerase-like protein
MNVSRRDAVVAGIWTLGVSGLLLGRSTDAGAAEESAVSDSVETLRKGILEADRAKLAQVTSEHISYGHSDGRVQDKEEFIKGVVTRKQVVKTLTFPDMKISVVGPSAIVRHIYLSDSEQDGKATTTRIGALQVWQKQDGGWKLLARQGFRLPAPA